jgi:hypothetical protein
MANPDVVNGCGDVAGNCFARFVQDRIVDRGDAVVIIRNHDGHGTVYAVGGVSAVTRDGRTGAVMHSVQTAL